MKTEKMHIKTMQISGFRAPLIVTFLELSKLIGRFCYFISYYRRDFE